MPIPASWTLNRRSRSVPGEQYLLTLDFARPDTTGLLQIIGPGFYREYNLPRSGESRSFGSEPGCEKSITLWTTAQGPETVSLSFIPTAENARPSDYIAVRQVPPPADR